MNGKQVFFHDRVDDPVPVEISKKPAMVDQISSNYRQMLLIWARQQCQGYPGIYVNDFTHSWRTGRVFMAILHRHKFVNGGFPLAQA